MEQAFPATDRTWQAQMWRRFRRGDVATLKREFSLRCSCGIGPTRDPLTWAEKVDHLVTVPVFDAKFSGCDVTHWQVPFGWIPSQNGDEVSFS